MNLDGDEKWMLLACFGPKYCKHYPVKDDKDKTKSKANCDGNKKMGSRIIGKMVYNET